MLIQNSPSYKWDKNHLTYNILFEYIYKLLKLTFFEISSSKTGNTE